MSEKPVEAMTSHKDYIIIFPFTMAALLALLAALAFIVIFLQIYIFPIIRPLIHRYNEMMDANPFLFVVPFVVLAAIFLGLGVILMYVDELQEDDKELRDRNWPY